MEQPLRHLIAPHSETEFFDHFEKNLPLVAHDLGDGIRELTDLPFLSSLDALLQSWPDTIDAYLPGVADEGNSRAISVREAPERFRDGTGLLFNDVQAVSPVLERWLESLRNELGLSALTLGRNLVYAIPAGAGTAPHFDQNINFVLQLHGTKTWRVAPNGHVERPMSRYVIGLPTEAELATYSKSPMPGTLPPDAAEFVLHPGSLLFVPRGAWHATEAITDSISVNFTYTVPTWIDLLTVTLRSRLALSSAWRESAVIGRDRNSAGETALKLDALVSEAVRDMQSWNGADILAVTEGGRR